VWNEAALHGWSPPSCTGWDAVSFISLVAFAGNFAHEGGIDDFLARFGAISARRGIRYWSATDGDWRVLITDAAALDGPDAKRRRLDFSIAEMTTGADLFFVQMDTRSSGPVVFRMRVHATPPHHVMVEIENVTPVVWHFVTMFPPSALRTAYWMEYLTGGRDTIVRVRTALFAESPPKVVLSRKSRTPSLADAKSPRRFAIGPFTAPS
jgi:hypothetical protein